LLLSVVRSEVESSQPCSLVKSVVAGSKVRALVVGKLRVHSVDLRIESFFTEREGDLVSDWNWAVLDLRLDAGQDIVIDATKKKISRRTLPSYGLLSTAFGASRHAGDGSLAHLSASLINVAGGLHEVVLDILVARFHEVARDVLHPLLVGLLVLKEHLLILI